MRRYLRRVLEVVLLLLLLALLAFLFVRVLPYIEPFVIGWLIAIILLPVVRWVESRGVPRVPAVLTVLGGAVALFLLIAVYAVIAIAREATQLSLTIARNFDALQQWLKDEMQRGQTVFGQLPPKVAAGMETTAGQVLTSVESGFRSVVHALLSSLTHLPETFLVLVISLVAAFFMLARRERMYRRFLRALPPGWSAKVDAAIADMMRAFVGTLRVQVILMLLTAAMGVVGMALLRLPYAVILGLLLGVCGSIPVVGSALLTVPWAAGAFIVGDVPMALKVLLLQAVISLVRHVVEPKILADNVGLDMLSTLFALYVGMKWLGVIGLFFGPIILIGILSLFRAHMFVEFFAADADQEQGAGDAAASRDGDGG